MKLRIPLHILNLIFVHTKVSDVISRNSHASVIINGVAVFIKRYNKEMK